jgi:hypothetical protein
MQPELLAPDIIDAILAGQTDQLEWSLPASWAEQHARIAGPTMS